MKLTRITVTFFEYQYTFLIISCLFLVRMGNVSERSYIENQNTHFIFNNFFENHAVYEIMWKSVVEPDRSQMAIWCMHVTCWMTKATNTHSQYAVLIALPLQQWLHECASVLRYTYIACLVY